MKNTMFDVKQFPYTWRHLAFVAGSPYMRFDSRAVESAAMTSPSQVNLLTLYHT